MLLLQIEIAAYMIFMYSQILIVFSLDFRMTKWALLIQIIALNSI